MTQIHGESFEDKVDEVLLFVGSTIKEKNRKYGDAALNPLRVFSRSSPEEQLRVRIDDKLSRVKNRQNDEDEDPILDLMGYLVLYKIALMSQG